MLAAQNDCPAPKMNAASAMEIRRGIAQLSPELFGRALRMARSPQIAEDLVQDTAERALRFQAQYTPGTNLRAWLFQILFSVFVTRCRRGRRERNALDVLSVDPCAWTIPDETTVEMQDLSPPVARALESIPVSFRKVVVLVDLHELSYKDAAKKLGVPVGTVMSRLHRGRRLLADTMRGTAPTAPAPELQAA
jgi:RNA polymerase sigma-70 factor, ECF subfamily